MVTPNASQFPQHPLDIGGARQWLGVGSTLVKSVSLASGDVLVIPPPPVVPAGELSILREVSSFLSQLTVNPTTAITNNAGVYLVYKAESGKEAILSTDIGVHAVNAPFTSLPNGYFTLAPTDRGIFLRNLSDGVVDACTQFADSRGPGRTSINLTTAQQTVLSADDPNSVLTAPYIGNVGFPTMLYNFDPVVSQVVDVFLSDGVNTMLISDGTPVAPQSVLSNPIFQIPPALQNGWSLLAAVQPSAATILPRLVLGYQPTNLVPVRPNQGGAY